MGKLEGTTAVVTGGGTGIGRHIALALAAEGAKVAVVARRKNKLDAVVAEITAQGGVGYSVTADLIKLDEVEAAFSDISKNLGPIDTLVNNAGCFSAIGPIWEVEPDEWWSDVEINIKSAFYASRSVVKDMKARGSGRIVNLIGGGTSAPLPIGSGYSISKTGIMRFTECIAATLEGSGVVCLAIAPGLVRTEMTEYQLNSEVGKKYMSKLKKRFADGDGIPPSYAANLIVDIASGRFDRLNGRAISANENLERVEARIDDAIADNQRVLQLNGFNPQMKPLKGLI